ncbi:MAG: DoxX family protein [Bacteroidetes bacterium]|nr:DoxX family protein [Bacteroidota bacterium]
MLVKIANYIIPTFFFLFWAITFLESAISKFSDIKGNQSYFKSVFEKTFIAPFINPTFWLVASLEVITGLLALLSIIFLYVDVKLFIVLATYTNIFIAALILMLFAGQRIAKDYQGASGIVPYIIVAALGLVYFFRG